MSTPLNRYHPPFFQVTPTDHTAWIAVATVLGLCCTLVTLLIRFFVRFVIHPPLGRDDLLIFAATASTILSVVVTQLTRTKMAATVQSSIVVYGVSNGLGKSVELITPDALLKVEKAAYASDILYLLSAYLSKCSVTFLLLRLSPASWHKAFYATLAGLTVCVVVSIMVMALRCDLSQPWVLFHQKCTAALLLRWQILTALDIFTEVVISAMSVYLVHDLQMALKKKFIVVGLFGIRLAAIPFLIIRVVSFPRYHLSNDPTYALTYFYIWTQTALYISLITSIAPCLKPFVVGLNTGYGAFDTEYVATGPGSLDFGVNGRKRSTVDGLSGKASTVANMKRSLNPKTAGRIEERAEVIATNEESATAQDSNSIGSNESQQRIIRKDVEWRVEYSSASPSVHDPLQTKGTPPF